MKKEQWLDLLLHNGASDGSIHGATFALLIENKVNHWLANDLANYWDSIPALPYKAGVVLGLRQESMIEQWQFVSHLELARAVDHRLGPVLGRVNPRYLPVLLHLLEYLKQMSDPSRDAFTAAFDFAQQHRAALGQAQQLISAITPAGLATAVAEAFGESYLPSSAFDNRVDIRHKDRTGLRYIVFFGDVLDLSKAPEYTITFYAGGAHKREVAAWRAYLMSLPQVQAAGLTKLPWFMYDELVIGKQYPFVGTSLADLKADIARSLQQDWQPLEPEWLTFSSPPTPGEALGADSSTTS